MENLLYSLFRSFIYLHLLLFFFFGCCFSFIFIFIVFFLSLSLSPIPKIKSRQEEEEEKTFNLVEWKHKRKNKRTNQSVPRMGHTRSIEWNNQILRLTEAVWGSLPLISLRWSVWFVDKISQLILAVSGSRGKKRNSTAVKHPAERSTLTEKQNDICVTIFDRGDLGYSDPMRALCIASAVKI